MSRFSSLKLEGGLIASDIIDQIADGVASGQKLEDFGLKRRHLTDEIAATWAEARQHWIAFQHRIGRIDESESATTITRNQWCIPFLSLLGYELTYMPSAAVVDGRSFAISHRAGSDSLPSLEGPGVGSAPPLHIVSCLQLLDRRPESGRPRFAPHSLVQEYLNRTEHLWGIVTNGDSLRLLRDSQLMSRFSYIEFDLRGMMEGERFSDFALLYRLIHRSRLPQSVDDAPDCFLEEYRRLTIEQGGRVRDKLRDGVKDALEILANGLLSHPKNATLFEQTQNGNLTAEGFYQQLLRLVYRLLFLMVAEERNFITDNPIYRDHYSVSRLRSLAEIRTAYTEHDNLWLGFQTTLSLLNDEKLGKEFGIAPLNGELFDSVSTRDLEGSRLINRDFLTAIWNISMYREDERTPWRRVNYSALDVEELGSVYESLLDFHPVFTESGGRSIFEFVYGTERKSTGSYYTRPELVGELIKSALAPVVEKKLEEVVSSDTTLKSEEALLSIKVCDPACGSGHFLLAAARYLGKELARIRTEEEEPGSLPTREAIRDVIAHCIYGVDLNPLAVDLCKVALWIEGHCMGKPLTFLDHRIRRGNSLVGVFDPNALKDGIPDDAFKPVTGDDKTIASKLKNLNKKERSAENQLHIPFPIDEQIKRDLTAFADDIRLFDEFPDDDVMTIRDKRSLYEAARQRGTDWFHDWEAYNLWTAPFFVELDEKHKNTVPTSEVLWDFLEDHRRVRADITGYANSLALKHRFFHWVLEFPDVFEEGGFDVVLCNPPWEQIKLQEKEFFATRDTEIANVPNKAARERLIKQLPDHNPGLWHEFMDAKHTADAQSKFLRESGRFPLTASGDINTYSVFAELFTKLIKHEGRSGVIVPTGIATGNTNKEFFAQLAETNLISLFDFSNIEKIFPSVDGNMKFCLLTLGGSGTQNTKPQFVFFATRTDHLRDERRHFTLTGEDFRLINPNTCTCPIFRTRYDAELTKKIYRNFPVLVNETTGKNLWGVRFLRMIDMTNDSHLFRTQSELEAEGFELVGNRFVRGDEVWLPLYEGKMMWHFDHRFAHADEPKRGRQIRGTSISITEVQHKQPDYVAQPRYWVAETEVNNRLPQPIKWLIGFRNVTGTVTNVRTAIFSLLPLAGVGNSIPLLLPKHNNSLHVACLVANLSSFVFDWVVRNKIAGMNMNFFYVQQFPVLSPTTYAETDLLFIVPTTLELIYTAWDMMPYAYDLWREADDALRALLKKQWEENRAATGGVSNLELPDWIEPTPDGIPFPPFKWDEDRRAILRAELDAHFARLYGLTEEELRYILDPSDVFGEDYPGETFRVLKAKEIRKYGEYRTKRLVLEAWDKPR